MKRVIQGAALVCLGLLGGACGGQDLEQGEELGTEREEITNGTVVTSDTWGSPRLPGCSSTLLRNNWILTAKHCGVTAGTTVTLRNGSSTTVTNQIFNYPSMDVTVARLSAPLFPEGPATTRGPFPLYKGSSSKLLNLTPLLQGWGANVCTGPNNCSGAGILRSGQMLIDAVNQLDPGTGSQGNVFYRMTTTMGLGQMTAFEDSGSGARTQDSNVQKRKVIGVHVKGDLISKSWQISASTFRDWANGIIGSAPTLGSGGIAGLERGDTTSAVVYRNASNHIIEIALGNTGTWSASDMTALVGAPNSISEPTAMVRSDGVTSYIFRGGVDGHINELALPHGGAWQKADLTTRTGALPAAGNPSAYARSDRVATVVYRATNNHVYELRFTGGSWAGINLSAHVGSPTASGEPVGFVKADGSNSVVYVGSDNRIREMRLAIDGSFVPIDITQQSGATTTSRLRPYTRSDGVSVILYRNQAGHVMELSQVPGSNWVVSDFHAIFGFPIAHNDPIGYVRSDGTSAIIYKGADQHIHEIALYPAGWFHGDLNNIATNAPPLANGSGVHAYVRADRTNVVLYRTADQHIHELSLTFGGGWVHNDLGAPF